MEAEDWDERRHYDFLTESGLLDDETHPGESVGLTRSDDEAGQSYLETLTPELDILVESGAG